MKTYIYCLATHIAGILLLTAGGIFSYLHHLVFCTAAATLLIVGLSFSLYRIQMRQIEMMRRIVECMKRGDLTLTAHSPFRDRVMQELATDLSAVLADLRHKLLDEEIKLQYYENLLDKVDTAVIVIDKQGHAEWMNKAAQQLTGESNQLPDEIMTALRERHQVARLVCGQTTLDLVPTATLIHLQQRERWIVSLKNIHSALEHTEMEAWQKLIRVLTHEIMNSITPIISLAETLSERSKDHPNDERMQTHVQQGLQVIYRRSKGLLEFVENYRKLTRIAPPEKTTFLVRQFFADLQRLHADPSFRFSLPDEQLALYADRTQLEQVFINLLKNAKEACTGTERPCIETTVSASAEMMTFTVTDNGEGMLPEVTERIFVPFFTTKPNGSGIGLSLCKQIISLHGGQIAVQSKPGKGSRFIITLPKPNRN